MQKAPEATAKKSASVPTASERARLSFLEFVREAVGEDIQVPENITEAAQPDGNLTDQQAEDSPTSSKSRKQKNQKPTRRFNPKSLTINVNYVFGAGVEHSGCGNSAVELNTSNTTDRCVAVNNSFNTLNIEHSSAQRSNWTNLPGSTPIAKQPNLAVIAYNYDIHTRTIEPVVEELSEGNHTTQANINETNDQRKDSKNKGKPRKTKKRCQRIRYANCLALSSAVKRHNLFQKQRLKSFLRKRCNKLLTLYCQQLQRQEQHYQDAPLVQHFYSRFKALDLYSDLLIDLKMFCRNALNSSSSGIGSGLISSANGAPQNPSNLGKRARSAVQTSLEEEVHAARSKKANRQEENFRHMLLPDTPEDANRKDAIYAFNFYEKVEEVLKSSKRPEDCKKFNHILKSFDPNLDKVSNLYYKVEQLLLPDHPDLVEVFLTFLLPSEAAEIGKFFEHFMIINSSTFINKLNVYFNKQPAQMRKIFACLNELSEDTNVTMKKVESKILPLLKGNQFLIDWFMQQFPEVPPPQRLLPTPERINLKEVQDNQSGEFVETVTDLCDSSTNEQQPSCQLRYINGRIFYGSKITLPAKLSFMANNLQCSSVEDIDTEVTSDRCIHGIREHGEQRLAAAAAAAAQAEVNSDDNDRSEEDDPSKVLIIDTGTEEDSYSSIETCDDATLRAHAVRLNPSYYNSSYFASATSTPNPGGGHQQHHANSRKTSFNFNDEGKMSPRKHSTPTLANTSFTNFASTSPAATHCSSPNSSATNSFTSAAAVPSQLRDKRKSPTKKTKSPVYSTKSRAIAGPPMVVIHERNGAIACAKRLKSLIADDDNDSEADCKKQLPIVARAKNALENETAKNIKICKEENSEDLEFLPEHGPFSQSSLPPITMAYACTEDTQLKPQQIAVSSTHIDSDEDCKLDIVASLASTSDESTVITTQVVSGKDTITTSDSASTATFALQTAWTREEDKVILIEMKLGSRDRDGLFHRISSKLPNRTLVEITARHQFLMDFLSKLQGR